jgi:hypothetical protein
MSSNTVPVKAQAQSFDARWQVTFNEDTRYYSWRSSHITPSVASIALPPPLGPASGTIVYVPYGLQITGQPSEMFNLEMSARSGYAWVNESHPGSSTGVQTNTDTSVGATLTFTGWNGLQPFASFNVNIPTGTTVLLGNKALARPDPDLQTVPTFGEGWNIAPTVGVNVSLSPSTIVTMAFGYTDRNPYNREGSFDPITLLQGIDRLDPGNVYTTNASIGYRAGPLSLRLSGSHSEETATTLNGALFYKSGGRYFASGSAAYAWNENWSSSATVSFSHFNKNKVAIGGLPSLVLEALNSNSDITNVYVDVTYTQGNFAIGPNASFMYRDHNAWSPTALQFLSAKTSWAVGAVGKYDVSNKLSLNAHVERRWMRENDNADKIPDGGLPPPIPGTGIPTIITTGWMFSGGLLMHL